MDEEVDRGVDPESDGSDKPDAPGVVGEAVEVEPVPPSSSQYAERSRALVDNRSRIGKVLLGVAGAGILLAVAASLLGWLLLRGAGETVDATLELTGETVGTGSETVSLVGDALRSVEAGLSATSSATGELDIVLNQVGSFSDQASKIVGTDIPDGLDSARSSFPELAASLDSIAAALESLSFIGINISVDPAAPVRAVDTQLGELSAELRVEASRLALIGDGFTELSSDLNDVEVALVSLSTGIEDAERLLDDYQAAATDGEQLIVDARLDLDSQINTAQLVVLLFGLSIALAQIAPASVGWYLIRTS